MLVVGVDAFLSGITSEFEEEDAALACMHAWSMLAQPVGLYLNVYWQSLAVKNYFIGNNDCENRVPDAAMSVCLLLPLHSLSSLIQRRRKAKKKVRRNRKNERQKEKKERKERKRNALRSLLTFDFRSLALGL